MKRGGYKSGYDKNDVHVGPEDLPVIEEDTLEWKYAEKKKRLKINAIEFVVGIVLLGFCWMYLQTHPAEKVALFTGVEVIVQKVNIRFSAQGDDLKKKYDLERSFEEVISLAKGSDCIGPIYLADLKKQYKKLQGLDVEEFIKEKNIYAGSLGLAYRKIQNECRKKE